MPGVRARASRLTVVRHSPCPMLNNQVFECRKYVSYFLMMVAMKGILVREGNYGTSGDPCEREENLVAVTEI